ncbi:hypothetical protein [Bradyrhizobium sp. SZCCHNS1054]|uniref:hypothetical protein n=1 Tax=Bradyrhizobium sp. SZCCHNS1054 TaxID=3057301 RepID=UPI002916AAC4|nr:hypothetical protein [Bradyrhizobium sp. SZCCHNS1054]
MVKKTRARPAARRAKSDELSLAQAIKLHADAIRELAEALRTAPSTLPLRTMTAVTGETVAALARLSRQDILAELAKIWGAPSVKEGDDINGFFKGGPGAIVAFWEPLCDWPPFKARHLHLGPNDLRFVTTVGELVSVIDWGLRSAR